MPSTVEQLSPTRVKLTVEIPFSDLKPSLDKAYQQIASQVTIPGFRKGKVPSAIIDQRFGRASVLQEAINETIPDAYGRAVAENNITPLSQPEIELTKLEDGDVVEFVAEVDVRPDFDVPDFSQVKVSVDDLEVGDDAVDERVELLRKRFATQTEVVRAAAAGDVVTLDLQAAQDGVDLDDAKAEGVTYEVGSGGMLDGLDDAVTGLKAGEKATFSSKLAGGSMRDQEADITVTVTKVAEQELPALDDDFAQMVSEFDTVEEMRSDLAEGATRQARLVQANQARDKVLEALLEITPFELPTALVEAERSQRREQITNQLAQAGLTLEQYLADTEEGPKTEDEFWAEIEKSSEQAFRAQILLDKIADDRQIGVDQQDLTALIFRKASENGTSPEQELQHMQEHNHMPEWLGEVRRGKALGLIVSAAEITSADGSKVDLARLQGDGTYAEDAPVYEDEDASGEDAQTEAAPDVRALVDETPAADAEASEAAPKAKKTTKAAKPAAEDAAETPAKPANAAPTKKADAPAEEAVAPAKAPRKKAAPTKE